MREKVLNAKKLKEHELNQATHDLAASSSSGPTVPQLPLLDDVGDPLPLRLIMNTVPRREAGHDLPPRPVAAFLVIGKPLLAGAVGSHDAVMPFRPE